MDVGWQFACDGEQEEQPASAEMDAGRLCAGGRQEEQSVSAEMDVGCQLASDGEQEEQPVSAEMDAGRLCAGERQEEQSASAEMDVGWQFAGRKKEEQPACRQGDADDESDKVGMKSENAWTTGMQNAWLEQCKRWNRMNTEE